MSPEHRRQMPGPVAVILPTLLPMGRGQKKARRPEDETESSYNLLDCQRNGSLFSEAGCGGGARVSW